MIGESSNVFAKRLLVVQYLRYHV